MSLVSATLVLYRDSLVDAGRALGRSAWAVVALVIAYAVIALVARATAPLGFAGGFVMALVQAVVIGWYLSLVAIGVQGRRRVLAADLRDNIGHHWGTVISVLFVFWIASLVLMLLPPVIGLAAVIVATLAFNPIPEMVYEEDGESLQLLGDALRFMQQNWPEWVAAQLLGGLLLFAWGAAFHGAVALPLAFQLLQMFGPFFGFVNVGAYALLDATPRAFGGSVVLLAFTHFFLLFRGHLYRRLAGSSRRGRAWRARM
jgi:hypothetical protein